MFAFSSSVGDRLAAARVSYEACNIVRGAGQRSYGDAVCRCASCTELLLRRGKPLCPICRRGVQSYILREFEV